MRELKDSIAMVTGASRGIGFAIARQLAAESAEVVMVARNPEALQKAKRQISGKTLPSAADVTSPRDVGRLFRRLQKNYERLDLLVNCAGVFTYKPFRETTLADWRHNLESNLTSLFLVIQGALPLLGGGVDPHIVNILSVSSARAFPNCSAYTASKFGGLGFTRVLRKELQPLGIRVTAVLPGVTETDMLKEFGFEIPRERLMQPEDVANAVISALKQPARAAVEEIYLMPSAGAI